MDFIEKKVIESLKKRGKQSVAELEGYSSNELEYILYHTFDSNSPIQILKPKQRIYRDVPLFCQVKFLLDLINEKKELKLTKRGFLPTKVVADLYGKGYMKDYFIESGITKLYRESDVQPVHVAKILLELSSLVKKQNNKLSLTSKGIKAIDKDDFIFEDIFKTFVINLNWPYFDRYSDEDIGQFGFGFTLILLDKYGDDFRGMDFYAEKYLKALDFKFKNTELKFMEDPKYIYILRSFERFLDYFGFTEYENDEKPWQVKKTELFNEIIKIRKHNPNL
ncbi:MAG: hypothetical protein ACQERC_06395 [Bacteroidota bacterium]